MKVIQMKRILIENKPLMKKEKKVLMNR
jgi:hypothetical protein